jgi:NAD-dependent dihydropyrimidine dehydrogenase PreA subunit
VAIDKLDQEICIGCGICYDCCPQDVFRMDYAEKKAVIKYPEDCIACWACESFCPVNCIEVSKDRAMQPPPPYQLTQIP